MKRYLVGLFSLTFLASAQAQFFGGYADGVTMVPTLNNGSILQVVYDDFTFDVAGDIASFGLIGMFNIDQGSTSAIYYEIRSGMSPGNGGSLLFSGFFGGVTFAARPTDGSFGTPPPGSSGPYGVLTAGVSAASAIHLDAGTYWIGLAPVSNFGHYDVTSTQGLDAVGHPINNGNAFYFDSTHNFTSLGDDDFGLMVGTLEPTSVPEPASIGLLGVGGLILLYRIRKSV